MPTSPPSITTLPSAPDPNNRTTFNTLAYPWSAALPTFGTELSAVAANAYANALEAESSLQAIGGRWAFDSTTTMADPGTGDLRMNHATVASVTALAISALSAASGNPNLLTLIATWDDSTSATRGTITLCKVGAPGTFAVFAVVGAITDNTTWLQIPVTHVGSSGAWSAADGIYAAFARAGDAGATGPTFTGGTLTSAINEAHGADIASAGTINLTTATGNLVDVTGTTTITAITLADGAERTVRFTGVLTLTHGASLVLPGGASITTAAGDFAVFRGYAAGVVRCTEYTKANGRAVVGTACVPVWASRDVSLAAGSVAYTGFGGTPISVDIYAVGGGTQAFSIGSDNGTASACVGQDYAGSAAQSASRSVQLQMTSGNYVFAEVASFSTDTVTLSWTKTGSPTGTAYLIITARF